MFTLLIALLSVGISPTARQDAVLETRDVSDERTDTDSSSSRVDSPPTPNLSQPRLWTDRATGRQVEATFLELTKDHVIVERPDGRRSRIPFDRLSETDRDYVRLQAKSSPNPGQLDSSSPRSSSDDPSPGVDPSWSALPDRLQSIWTELSESIRERRLGAMLAPWLEGPTVAVIAGGWLGLAALTSFTALLFGRSPIGWFLIGLLFPLLGLAQLLELGDDVLPPHRRAALILLLRFALLTLGLGALGVVGWIGWSADGFDITPLRDRVLAHPAEVVILAALGAWALTWYLTCTLAALLHRSFLSACIISLLPCVGGLLYVLLRSRRRLTRWATVFPVRKRVSGSQIRVIKSTGHLDPSTRVYWRSRVTPTANPVADAERISIEAIGVTRRQLGPADQDLRFNATLHICQGGAMFLVIAAADNTDSAARQPEPRAVPQPGSTTRGAASQPQRERTIATLIELVTRPASLNPYLDERRELVRRRHEAGPLVLDALDKQVQLLDVNMRAGKRANWDGCMTLIQLLGEMAYLPAAMPLMQLGVLLCETNIVEQAKLSKKLLATASQILGTVSDRPVSAQEAARPSVGSSSPATSIPSGPPPSMTLEEEIAAKTIVFPSLGVVCDLCNCELQTDDMFAISPRYDVPTNPNDVARIYCRNCAGKRFFENLKHEPALMKASNQMAVTHLRQSGRLK